MPNLPSFTQISCKLGANSINARFGWDYQENAYSLTLLLIFGVVVEIGLATYVKLILSQYIYFSIYLILEF